MSASTSSKKRDQLLVRGVLLLELVDYRLQRESDQLDVHRLSALVGHLVQPSELRHCVQDGVLQVLSRCSKLILSRLRQPSELFLRKRTAFRMQRDGGYANLGRGDGEAPRLAWDSRPSLIAWRCRWMSPITSSTRWV